MILRGRELSFAVATGLSDSELQEMLGRPVVEPVDDLARDDLAGHGVVGQDLDVHALIDDLANLFLSAIGESNSGAVGHASEHDADFFPQLVNEDRGGLCLVERAGDLAEGLGHQPGLEADVAVPHLALDLGARYQGGDGVDDDDVDGAGADQHVRDLQRLLTGIRLGHQEGVGVDAKLLGVVRVERVLRVDEGRDAAGLLRVGDGMQRQARLAAALRPVDLDDPAPGEAADPERYVQGDRTGGDDLDRGASFVTEPHDGATAELPFDLRERGLQRLVPVADAALAATRLVVRCHLKLLLGKDEGYAEPLACAWPELLCRASGPARQLVRLSAGGDATRTH